MAQHDDDAMTGRILARREVLALFGTTAGAAVLVTAARSFSPRTGERGGFGVASAAAAGPSCVVRPELTEGPFFVDERLERSDIRSDPSDGSIRPGVTLALAFAVSRLHGDSCTPFEGVIVDVWHCDAAGMYSDVQDPGFNTAGQKFLRGYQVTDAKGAARFLTIYPGWYQGRTVHIHFKLRTDPDSTSGLEFTSQLFFDDELTDVVHAQQPYAAKGRRTPRNDGDSIYQAGGDRLLLSVSPDGSGGYVATFDIGILVSTVTPTTLVGATCPTVTTCVADLQAALPSPATSSSLRAKRTARRLLHRMARVATVLARAAASTGTAQTKRYGKARAGVQQLLSASRAADAKGTLEVPLAPIETAAAALLQLIARTSAGRVDR